MVRQQDRFSRIEREAAVSYRVFSDSRGTEWQAWDVVPKLAERRMQERRGMRAASPVERRGALDRRVIVGRRPMLLKGMNEGWLCFEARAEKRRLTPIPADWLECAEERLEQYCSKARVAPRLAEQRFELPESTPMR